MLQVGALLGLALGCAKSNTAYSGETHFMAVCDEECGAGLECICGVCTRPCERDRECASLYADATCRGPGTAAGTCRSAGVAETCSVACENDADCNGLGGDAVCLHGECRKNAQGSCARDGVLYADGRDGIAAGDGCNDCACDGGEFVCTRADCGDAMTGPGLEPLDASVADGSTGVQPKDATDTDSDDTGGEAGAPSPALVTLRGAIRVRDTYVFDGATLRIALVWYPAGLEDGETQAPPSAPCADPQGLALNYRGLIAQELQFEPFPTRAFALDPEASLPFTAQITELPPAEALRPVPEPAGGKWTAGRLILYQDANDNGRLDTATLAAASPDTVIGTSSDWHALVGSFEDVPAWYDIYYSDRSIPTVGPPVEAGFNLRQIVNDPEAGYPASMIAIDSAIDIHVRDSPRISTLLCEELCMLGDDTFICPAELADLPAGGAVECQGGSDLLWSRSTCNSCTCTNLACSLARPASGPGVDAWPCR
jgi:hypothetical protein